MTRKGRQWTWNLWEQSKVTKWRGNYATASILFGMVFCVLLAWALMIRAVAPMPADLNEQPFLLAKRTAGRGMFQMVYMPECEWAALEKIPEPYKALAKATGYFAPEAFAGAMLCLDERLQESGLPKIEEALRSNPSAEALFSVICLGDLRSFEPCQRAFDLAVNRGRRVAETLSTELLKREISGAKALPMP